MSKFANRLVELREKAGLSRQQLADSIGLSRASIEYYEKDKRHPDTEMVIKMAQYFHVTTDYLLGLSITSTHDKSLRDVCNYLSLPDTVVQKLKENVSDTLIKTLDSPEFWEFIAWRQINHWALVTEDNQCNKQTSKRVLTIKRK